MYGLVTLVRDAVFAAFCVSVAVAGSSWLVRTQKISPFSGLGRFLKKASDPVLVPVESRVVKLGGMPTHAGWWLVVGTAVVGLLLIWLAGGLVSVLYDVQYAWQGGFVGILSLLVNAAYDVLFIALVVRVVGTWVGVFRYSRWARPAYLLTDWLVLPIQKVLPTYSGFDFSPLVAWVILIILKAFLLGVVL